MKLSLPEFIRRWKDSELTERAGSQTHFIELCQILIEPHPASADPKGVDYAFEKHVNKTGDDKGYADVWKRNFFGWEYKGKHKDLKAPIYSCSSTARISTILPCWWSAIFSASRFIPTSPIPAR